MLMLSVSKQHLTTRCAVSISKLKASVVQQVWVPNHVTFAQDPSVWNFPTRRLMTIQERLVAISQSCKSLFGILILFLIRVVHLMSTCLLEKCPWTPKPRFLYDCWGCTRTVLSRQHWCQSSSSCRRRLLLHLWKCPNGNDQT